ncbi:uncharacterized protein METZ01_LOCUS465927, partial [marine metagenome]
MNKTNVFTTKYRDANKAHIPNIGTYKTMYDQSIKNPDKFWAEQSKRLDWFEKWKEVSNNDFTKGQIKWFEGGKLNASYNCLDRHVEAGSGNETAIIWEGNDPTEDKSYTYS